MCPRIKWPTQTSQLDIIHLVQSRALPTSAGKNGDSENTRLMGVRLKQCWICIYIVKWHCMQVTTLIYKPNASFKSLNLFLILFLNMNLFTSVVIFKLICCGIITEDKLAVCCSICSVSIRPGRPADCSPASFSAVHSASIEPAAVYDRIDSTIVEVHKSHQSLH